MAQLKRCLGVDLGQHTVKIVELAIERNAVRTIRAASAPTGVSPSMDADTRRQAIVSAARQLIKSSRFSTKDAVYAIPGQKVFVRRFRLPKTTEERLEKIIQYEARQQIPFPLDRTLLQYQYAEIPGEGEVEVVLVAVRSDEVKEFISMVDKVGPRPIAISVSSFALFTANKFINTSPAEAEKIFEELSKKKKKPAKKGAAAEASDEEAPPEEEFVFEEIKCYVNVGASYFDLAIPGKGGLIGFTRTVPMGGDLMTKSIMKNLKVESFEDAERIKVSSTKLMTFNFDFEGEGETNEEASLAVSNATDNMVKEMRRSLDFFITQPDGMAVDKVIISGGQSVLPGMAPYLEEKLAIPVEVITELPEGSPLKWQPSAGSLSQYMIAIGLALQGIHLSTVSIDFLPTERKITRDFPYRITAVMGLFLLAIALVASQAGKEYTAGYRNQAQGIQDEILRLEGQVRESNDTQTLNDRIARQYDELTKAFGQRDFWLEFIGEVARYKPPEILLQDVRMEHDGRVILTASSEVQVSAADFTRALNDNMGTRLSEQAQVENMIDLPTGGHRFTVRLKMAEKINHLRITPTPTPAATQPGGGNR